MELATELEQLHCRIDGCTDCPLAASAAEALEGRPCKRVVGEGPADARIMIVGEAPGAEEERTGRPFIGRSGRLLTEILAAAGLNRNEIFVTSVIKCRPPQNRTPLKSEVARCLPWLEAQMELIAPRVILTVGNVSTQTLLKTKEGINALRGSFYEYTLKGRIMALRPLYHPAYLLRNPRRVPGSPWDKMLGDLIEVRRYLESC